MQWVFSLNQDGNDAVNYRYMSIYEKEKEKYFDRMHIV